MRFSSWFRCSLAVASITVACGGNEFAAKGGSGGRGNGAGGAAGSGGSGAGTGTGGGSADSGSLPGSTDGGSTDGSMSGSGGSTADASGSTGGVVGSTGGTGSGGAGGAGGGGTTCDPATPLCVRDWAGVYGSTGNSADGVGAAARFGQLGHVTGDEGYLFVTDANAVRRIEIATASVTTIAGAPNQPGNVNLPGASARFGNLSGIATNGVDLWVADMTNMAIRVVALAGAAVSTLAPTPEVPRGLTFDGTNLYYVTEGSSIYRVDPNDGGTTQVVGGAGPGFLDGTTALARLDRPRALDALNTGQLLVGDTENHRVRAVDLNGSVVTTFAGSVGGYLDGPRATARFDRLRGVHLGGGALYIADSDNFVVRRIDLTIQNAGVVTLAGTAGVAGHQDGVGTAAQFDKPMDVYYHPGQNDLFVLEDTVIRRIYGP